MKHLTYLGYMVRHKWFVLRAGYEIGTPLARLLVHDHSKFTREEWAPYARWFGGDRSKESSKLFRVAHRLHVSRQDHHWDHWGGREMPEECVLEMVADWAGAGRAINGKWDALAWYEGRQDEIKLHPETRHRVRCLLGHLNRKGLA